MTTVDKETDSPSTPQANRDDVAFAVGGDTVRAWHYHGQGEKFSSEGGRAAVVMAHGLGATKDSALPDFAAALSSAGLDVVVFDYRNFGASDGADRQVVSIGAQLADYRAAVEAARGLPGVDADRIIVWGVSFSGGHVFQIAAGDPRIAGVVALTPGPDGVASVLNIVASNGLPHLLRCSAAGLRDALSAVLKRPPVLVPIVGRPATLAALNAEGALEKHLEMAGPSWRNELAARIFLRVGSYRPVKHAKSVRVPVLVQVADFDRSAPPPAAMRAAVGSRAEVRHYPCDHFDVYPGQQWFDAVITHQIDFLTRHFGTPLPS
jgi:pimeloyl-ACP methyl ester carboxylesterase